MHLLLSIYLSGELTGPKGEEDWVDLFLIDQLAAGIPVLRALAPRVPVLFYCHFPDLLLVARRDVWLRWMWRVPFDQLEGWGMRGADRVLVNSGFTRGVVEGVWPWLGNGKRDGNGNGNGDRGGVGIVYPCVDTHGDDKQEGEEEEEPLWKGKKVILSINRFEVKKDIGLAIRAFARLPAEVRKEAKLVIAGNATTALTSLPSTPYR